MFSHDGRKDRHALALLRCCLANEIREQLRGADRVGHTSTTGLLFTESEHLRLRVESYLNGASRIKERWERLWKHKRGCLSGNIPRRADKIAMGKPLSGS